METDLIPLDHLAVLRLRGADRVALVQGQASNDAARVDAQHGQLTSFNDPKGRCLAVALLLAAGDTHLLITHASVVAALCKRLRMYILRSQATVELEPTLRVAGRLARTADPAWKVEAGAGAPTITLPDGRGVRVVGQDVARGVDDGAWARADIDLGLVWLTAETSGACLPLWLGLERLGAIDYRKGCYTGQEIVARTHYLGKQKQSLHRARAAAAPATGATVRTADGGDAGLVLTSATDGAGGCVLLVSLRDAWRAAPLTAAGIPLADVAPVA